MFELKIPCSTTTSNAYYPLFNVFGKKGGRQDNLIQRRVVDQYSCFQRGWESRCLRGRGAEKGYVKRKRCE